ncbi:tumor necrosis factor receptor superfamily member 10C [Biomphalaria pfeifferi]|uniref:Tumor necrosis factor receptor superfamily member 10C n=1 Tax=Biomphalaria pfeifferi TaxID=112525 RepID=A0AAD8FJD5_BIOPF|nr:tumor necrosis factor receptor superfamily member 10C [Biomphalaria pfeifferi]
METLRKSHVGIYALTLFMTILPVCLAVCQHGQFLSANVCQKCPEDSFMDEFNHNHSACNSCTQAKEDEVEEQRCNATHNSVLICKNGTFNSNGRDLLCQPCTQCEAESMFYAKECQKTSDAICCPEMKMVLEVNNGSSNCNHTSKDTNYCCVLSAIVATNKDVSEPKPEAEVTQTEIYEMQEQSTSSENKSMPNINIDSNGELSTGDKAGIILGSIAGFTVVIAIIIGAIYLFRRRKSGPENYQSTPAGDVEDKEDRENL